MKVEHLFRQRITENMTNNLSNIHFLKPKTIDPFFHEI